MDRIVKRVNQTRTNWLEAFKVSCNIHGYNYYDIPENLRYRYPAPGSCALEKHSYPHLFKKHWKTPFRDSNYNLRMREHNISWEDDAETYISEVPHLDPNKPLDAEILKQHAQPNLDDLYLVHDHEEDGALDSPENLDELWDEFEDM